MTIVLDYDNDQIRLEGGPHPAVIVGPVTEKTLKLIGNLLSDIFNRIDLDALPRVDTLDLTLRRQSDGELTTLEEW